ncbi:MAG: hypothetical protein C5B50_05065, partial [Verrucomicrobia bacterium]
MFTTQDQTQYTLTRDDLGVHDFDGSSIPHSYEVHAYGNLHLSKIKSLPGDTTFIYPNSIIHTDASGNTNRMIVFQRNDQGLISAIFDPNSLSAPDPRPSTLYLYDSNTNLMSVSNLVDRASGRYVGVFFTYTNSAFPHYITGIIDGRGIQVARNLYDDSGKLIGITDPQGQTTWFTNNFGSSTQTVTDRNGNTTTLGYDKRGNVISTVDALNHLKQSTYNDDNDKIGETNYLNGVAYAVSSSTYTNHLLLTSINPLGYSNVLTYDGYGKVLTTVDARGHGMTNIYNDTTGNLIGTVDAQNHKCYEFFSGHKSGRTGVEGILAVRPH